MLLWFLCRFLYTDNVAEKDSSKYLLGKSVKRGSEKTLFVR